MTSLTSTESVAHSYSTADVGSSSVSLQREERLVAWFTAIFFVGIASVMARPLFSHSSWMIFIQDDFLYYLKVAQSIAQGHGSTFNGITETNGYQPLWLAVLVLLSYVTNAPKLIFGFIVLSGLAASCVTFVLARKILATTSVRPLLVFSFAAWTTLYSTTLFFYGMEVTLTVPLTLGVVCLLRKVTWLQEGPAHTFALGLLLSAMVLSRIDTLILCGLIVVGVMLSPSIRRLVRVDLLLGLLCGLLPIVGYFFLNHFLFHTWLPVSGMAKELRSTHLPSIEPWRVFFHPLAGFFATVLLTALSLVPLVRTSLVAMERVIFSAVILFPFTYYFILSCVSDWTLWGWYYYPIRSALCVSFLIFCLYPSFARILQTQAATIALAVSVAICLIFMRWTRQQTDIYAASVEIQQFALAHPGIYAMGDRAGRVAYLIPNPVVQTEGLMMNREYLRFIEHETPLRETLAHYKVRYYVATAYEPFSGCFQAVEPAKAGPESSHMRAEFCEKPLALYSHDGIQTLIFDLRIVE
ncbi:MAG: hypothetical protein JWM43_3533 [Acidobacteriaceae bacterium]|nr:hypothetical protein [Acidobacteriaceae bacterium]